MADSADSAPEEHSDTASSMAMQERLAQLTRKWQEQSARETATDQRLSKLVRQYQDPQPAELPPVQSDEFEPPRKPLFGWGVAQWASALAIVVAIAFFAAAFVILPRLEDDTFPIEAATPTAIPPTTIAPTATTQPTATPVVPTATQVVAAVVFTVAPTATVTPAPTATATPSPTPAATSTPFVPDIIYTVQEGDTLGTISVKFKVDPDFLAAYNHLSNADLLHIDQKLRIPAAYTPSPTKTTATRATDATPTEQALSNGAA